MSVKISDLTALTGANTATDDEYVIVDKNVPETKKQTRAELFKNTPAIGIKNAAPDNLLHIIHDRTPTTTAVRIDTYDGTTFENSFLIQNTGATTRLCNFQGFQIALATSNTDRVTIDASGNVGIGTSSPATLCHINGTIRYTNRPAAGTITAIGYDSNGDLKNSSSSLRYKYDINGYAKGLDVVMQLRPVTFKFNGETRENAGFIAEEIDALGLTEVMLYDEEERPDGVLYANMVALLTKAMQEANAKIDALADRLEELEDSI
jgi:hypothetical protein